VVGRAELVVSLLSFCALFGIGWFTFRIQRRVEGLTQGMLRLAQKQARLGPLTAVLGTCLEMAALFEQQGLEGAPLGSTSQGTANVRARRELMLRLFTELAAVVPEQESISAVVQLVEANATEWTADLLRESASEIAAIVLRANREGAGPV